MQAMKAYLPPLARLLMSSLFIWDGILQLRDPSGTAKYFANVHVPIPVAVWISIVFHLLAGLSILVGFKIRWAAAALVVFCLGTGFGIHLAAGDFNNMIHFYKELSDGRRLPLRDDGRRGCPEHRRCGRSVVSLHFKLTFDVGCWHETDVETPPMNVRS
jgi:putative oxidoreductase